jgi:O-antigen/teichoic acid export membrane protein
MQDVHDVGLFRVAQRGAELIPFGLFAVNMAIAPTISEMFTKGHILHLQKIINKSILASFVFALPVGLVMILGGQGLISIVFGTEYGSAYTPLVILCLGQIVNVIMGPVNVFLNMTGFELYSARGAAIAVVINIILSITTIPFWGYNGAAIAATISLITWNIILLIWAYKKTGILCTIDLKAL